MYKIHDFYIIYKFGNPLYYSYLIYACYITFGVLNKNKNKRSEYFYNHIFSLNIMISQSFTMYKNPSPGENLF